MPSPEVDRPKTPNQYDIFNQVFINSSPLESTTLYTANALLISTINGSGVPSTPVRQYIQKLTVGTEQLQARSIVHQLDANNLHSVIKRRTIRTKGKRVVLKGHFHISTQELYDAVMEAENVTQKQSQKKRKTKGKHASSDDEIEEYIEEEAEEHSWSDTGSCIIVDRS